MPFLKSHTEKSGPGNVFQADPEIYRHWAEMGQALINGPSPLTPGEREMIQGFVAGLINCQFAYVAHSAAAVARGMMQLARDTGLTREGLYKTLSLEGNPSFATVMKVCKALGVKMHTEPVNA